MHNDLYKFLTENNLLYWKHIGFQKGYSTEHAILQVVGEINQSFEKNEFTVSVFVDLFKAFDTVQSFPTNFTKKIECYSITGNYLRWFENYLKDRKQFISFEHASTKKATVTCGVPQGSILGSLLFLLYVNDLHHSLKALNRVMFVDDKSFLLTQWR